MGLPLASPAAIQRLRVPAAPSPRLRLQTSGKRMNREQASARVVRGAGAHAVTGPAMPVDEFNGPSVHSTLVHPTS